jgi:hypothetical protein
MGDEARPDAQAGRTSQEGAPRGAGAPRSAAVLLAMGALALLVVAAGVVVALGNGGVARYLSRSKRAEGAAAARRLAAGVAACAQGDAGLPPSSPPVPASLASVRGTEYVSSPADWAHPTWACARFSLAAPQRFRFQWERPAPDHGTVRAEADLDGDGAPDASFEIDVSCSPGGACVEGPLRER